MHMLSFVAAPRGRTLLLAFALYGAFVPARGFAQLSVDELELRIRPENAQQRTVLLRVTNNSDAPAQAMLEVQDWRRDELGQNQYSPTGTVAGSCGQRLKVFPAVLPLAARATETVRITYDGEPTADCWSIVFIQNNERPRPQSNQSQITYIIRTGVKVYVERETAARAGDVESVAFTTMPVSETDTTRVPALQVVFRNTGSAHLKAKGAVEVRSADNAVVATLTIDEFPIAPGDTRRYDLRLPPTAAGRYVALALIDYGGTEIAAGQAEFEVR